MTLTPFSLSLQTTRCRITSPKLPTACCLRAVILTDLHDALYGDRQRELTAAIDALRPDLLLMSGDIAEEHDSHTGTRTLLEAAARRYPCFYASGNHEARSDELPEIKRLLRRYGVIVLEGGGVTFGGLLIICGCDDPALGRESWRAQLQRCAAAAKTSGLFSLLLLHRPELAAKQTGFDLCVSGHAHGGQVRIPGVDRGLYAPGQGLLPRYTGGLYAVGSTNLLVSRGLAKNHLPRVFNRPELICLELCGPSP